jgi:mRNA interferase RelE/StbE
LDAELAARIAAALRRVAADPYWAPNVKALAGGGHRLRVGEWRILYELKDAELVVLVVEIGHRREVYRHRP